MHCRTVIVSVGAEAAVETDEATEMLLLSKLAENGVAADEEVGGNGSEGPKREEEDALAEPNAFVVVVAGAAAEAESSNVGVADLDLAADSKAFLNASKGLGAAGAADVVVVVVDEGWPHASEEKGSTVDNESLAGVGLASVAGSSSFIFST